MIAASRDGRCVDLTAPELSDIVTALLIRVQDEERMAYGTRDAGTRRRCLDAAERLSRLARKLAVPSDPWSN